MVAHGPLDLSWIDEMDLSEERKASLRHLGIEADSIQKKFEPEHVWSWGELLGKIEEVRHSARINAVLFGGLDLSMFDEDLSRPRRLWNRLISMLLRLGILVYTINPKKEDDDHSDSKEVS